MCEITHFFLLLYFGMIYFSGVGWDSICLNVAAAMKEVVLAWEQGALSATDVKRILDNMRQTMCCLPICASNWLCSYMQVTITLWVEF